METQFKNSSYNTEPQKKKNPTSGVEKNAYLDHFSAEISEKKIVKYAELVFGSGRSAYCIDLKRERGGNFQRSFDITEGEYRRERGEDTNRLGSKRSAGDAESRVFPEGFRVDEGYSGWEREVGGSKKGKRLHVGGWDLGGREAGR